MSRRTVVVLALLTSLSLVAGPAQGWSASTSGTAAGRARTTTLQPVDSALTATCVPGLLNLSMSIRLNWTDTPQSWVDGYEILQRVGNGAYPASGTTVAVAGPGLQSYEHSVPITVAGTYTFAVRSKAQAWRSVNVESAAKVVTTTLGLNLTYSCS